ncbi:MAG: N-acetylmuramoyl-L-alanine amidase LytC [Actinomycetota bacterium]|jgi:putative cell wall-binding protein
MLRSRLAGILIGALVIALASPTTVAAQPRELATDPAATRICTETSINTSRDVVRIAGPDRYQTAIAVSRFRFGYQQGCTVSVASGRTFPDALTAAANITYGPLLLIPGDSLPSAVRTEIGRLDPAMIVSYGGRAVITPTVTSQLGGLVGGLIVINGGANRFGTAMVASFDNSTGTTAYIATGADFPDALAAVPLIRRTGGAFLLVERTGIPSETRQALTSLRPSNIVIIGGTGSVSDAVAQSLRAFTSGTVTRIQGTDRFETAVNISREADIAATGVVVVVSGRSFPDALSASSLDTGPILLVDPTFIPDVVRDRLQEIQPFRIIIVGGTASVSAEVEAELEQYLSPVG